MNEASANIGVGTVSVFKGDIIYWNENRNCELYFSCFFFMFIIMSYDFLVNSNSKI